LVPAGTRARALFQRLFRRPAPVVFRTPADLADLRVLVLLLAAVRPVAPALRVPVVRLVPAFVVRVEARGVAFRVEEDGFAAREAAARAVRAPVALPPFRAAAVPVFFTPAELLFLLPVPVFAVAPLFCLPVFADFTPRGMSLLLWYSCRSVAMRRNGNESSGRCVPFRAEPHFAATVVALRDRHAHPRGERSMNQQDKDRMGGQQGGQPQGGGGKDDQARRPGQQQQQQGTQGDRDRKDDMNREPQQGQRNPSGGQRDQR
jgi:hypothetical protein